MKHITLTLIFLVLGISIFSQNVAINSTGAIADASSMLDVSSTTTGILVPRIALSATNVAAPVTAPTNSLLIYNTATNGTANTAVSPGYYYWNAATNLWTRLVNNNDAWLTTGNYLSTNGIFGSMTNFSVNLGTNGLARGAMMNTGEFFLNGGMAYFGGDIFSAYATGGNSAVNGYLSGTGAGFASYFQSTSTGATSTIYAVNTGTNTNAVVLHSEVPAGGTGWNIYALTPAGNTRPAIAGNSAALNSTAVVGSVNGTANMVTLVGGSGGAFTHPTTGVYGTASTVASGTGGVFGGNGVTTSTLLTGSGVAGTGTTTGVFGTTTVAASGTGGVFAGNAVTSITLVAGSGVAATGSTTGVYGRSTTVANGNGGVFGGNSIAPFTLATGAGVSGTGTATGVFGYASTNANGNSGGYFQRGGANFAYVSANIGGTDYKIYGTGNVSTVVPDLNNNPVTMFCPEAPEMLFQDFGSGTLINGEAYIQLDPVYAKNVKIDSEHPLRVIIQLEGDCNGVYVTEKTANGFKVKELQNGSSNVNFTWFVTANRIDTKDANGNITSLNEDLRFPQGVGPQTSIQAESQTNSTTTQTTTEDKKEVIVPEKTQKEADPGIFKVVNQ